MSERCKVPEPEKKSQVDEAEARFWRAVERDERRKKIILIACEVLGVFLSIATSALITIVWTKLSM